jgi:hypothetical protein
MSRLAGSVAALYFVGCNAAVPDGTPFGSASSEVGTSSANPSTSTTSSTTSSAGTVDVTTTTTTTSSTSDASVTGSGGGVLPDFGDVAPMGCGGKIDIIFAISTEYPMKEYQPRLIAAFPEFAQALEEELGGFDLHILVTDSSFVWGMSDCSQCKDPDDCDPNGEPSQCGAKLDACDTTMGAGETFSSGIGSSGRRCELAGGHRYITDEEEDLEEAFTCLARVGYAVATPMPFDSILAALDHPLIESGIELNAPGGCNEGFLRDDALLLLVIIQNSYDSWSLGGPYQWRKALYAVKGGDEDAVIARAITADNDIVPSLCAPDGPQGNTNRMRLFMEDQLKHGNMASICAPAYGQFFKDVAAKLAPLCDKFIPR